MTLEQIPPLNAALNGLSTLLLITAYVFIRRGRENVRIHATLMISAFAVSSIFLGFYLVHKFFGQERTTAMLGITGWLKGIYLFILIPHVILAMVMLPMIISTFYMAWKRRWESHKKIARPTFIVWLYVSVTGVVIYWMLYHLLPSVAAQQH